MPSYSFHAGVNQVLGHFHVDSYGYRSLFGKVYIYLKEAL